MGKKVFISHCHKDKDYADAILELLKTFGFQEKDIFYSSNSSTGVIPGERIFERLKQELINKPIMVYILSEDYYKSTVCLNEMGASWVMTDEHYPIALPEFSPEKIAGAIGNDRLAMVINSKLTTMDIFRLVEHICISAAIEWPSDVKLKAIDYIEPTHDQLRKVTRDRAYLRPDANGFFEMILGNKKNAFGEYRGKAYRYQLSSLIAPEFLKMDELPEEEHYLYIWKNQGEFESGDRVKFALTEKEEKGKQLKFPNKSPFRNIYISSIERIVDEEREVQG